MLVILCPVSLEDDFSTIIDSMMFGIPVDNNISVMKLLTESFECYPSNWIFPTKILIFNGMGSFANVITKYNDLYRLRHIL